MGTKDEEDIQPAYLPPEVMEFIDDAREVIADNTGVDAEDVVFKGFTMHFDVGGKDITFEGVKLA